MRSRSASYEERFCRFSGSIEKTLIVGVVCLFMLMVFCQFLLTIPGLRSWLVETEQLEGQPTPFSYMRTFDIA